MKVLVTGSAGHLGESVMRRLQFGGKQQVAFLTVAVANCAGQYWKVALDAMEPVRQDMHDEATDKLDRSPLHKLVADQ